MLPASFLKRLCAAEISGVSLNEIRVEVVPPDYQTELIAVTFSNSWPEWPRYALNRAGHSLV